MNYLHWQEKTITDFSENNISALYGAGYVFTRIGKGVMHQTRSVRIDLVKFQLTSENRRILKKVAGLVLYPTKVPLQDYDFTIGKLAKDFYDKKFGAGTMSAQKVKEMLTDTDKSNFNLLLRFASSSNSVAQNNQQLLTTDHSLFTGFAICHLNFEIFHYSYPFYNLNIAQKDMGLGMMILAIEHAKNAGCKYIYLGSLQRPADTYKLQFEGLEWFDGEKWSRNIDDAKKILTSNNL